MKRSEVWWARLPEPLGRRPVVLVSRDIAYLVRTNVTAVGVTTRIRNLDTEVPLGTREGLPKRCVANADNLHTLPKSMLEARIGVLGSDKARALDEAIKLSLGLS